MDLENEITIYDRMSLALFNNSFPLIINENDTRFAAKKIPCTVDPEVVIVPEIRALGVEERWLEFRGGHRRIITFKPHSFFELKHLDLPDFCFFRCQENHEVRDSMKDQIKFPLLLSATRNLSFVKQQERLKFIGELHNGFIERCMRELLCEIIRRIGNNSYPTAKFTRNLVYFHRTVFGLKALEAISVARFCLNRLFERRREDFLDGIAVIEVLEEFFKSPLLKEDLVVGTEYSSECLDYILKCCTALKFDVKRFLTVNHQRQQQIPFCPVSSCILSGHGNIRKLKVLLSHGFELQMLNFNMKQVTYVMVKMYVQMRYNRIDPAVVTRTHVYDDRRMYIILTFLYLVCCSLRRDKEIFIESCKMLFSSIPDPFVSRDEIYRLLNSMYQTKIPEEIVDRCSLFKDTYIRVSMPRTLKHLCRCAVRTLLGGNFYLPASAVFCVDLLQIPITLTQYLNVLEF